VSIGERLSLATLATVVLTTCLVVLIGRWLDGPGAVAAQAFGGAVALGLSWLVMRAAVLEPLRSQVEQLIAQVRRGRTDGLYHVDPELVSLQLALDTRVQELGAASDRLNREARIAGEVLETSPFGTALIDADGHITSANPTFRRLFRLRGEPVGKRPIEVVPVAEIHEVVEEALAGRTAEKTFVTASQDLIARAQPLSGGRAIVRVEDVTVMREAERSRTDFVANVSHELRTPIAAIMGYLETIQSEEDRLPADLVPLLETVERNARRLRDLFEDLLKLHRIEARRRELPLERRKLQPLLEAAVGPSRDRAKMRNQEFELQCAPDLEGLVNPEALTAIVGNLASNASAYSTDGGHVRVRALKDDRGQVRIEVQDDGIGIPERHQERIFERFYRVDEARSRRIGGTGLGLAIVKHYALAARCNVTLKSKEGQGSTFTVELPRS
jgi:two-component system, OmpR family, phosphate regulon sensor histidine kinase PhoR